MRPKLYCYGVHIAGICLLFYIAKAQLFNCDENSLKGTLKCKSGECCTPQMTNVIKADITGTNSLCVFGIFYTLQDKLQGQKCVHVSGPCEVELSYCYTEEVKSTIGTWDTLPPKITSDNQSTPILAIGTASSPGDENVRNVQPEYTSIVTSSIHNPVTYNTRNTLNSEEITRSNTHTRYSDGVIFSVPVVAVFLIVIFVSIFLYIRRRRKVKRESTNRLSNAVVRFSNSEYVQMGSCGNSHELNEQVYLTTLPPHGIPDDTPYSNINQRNSTSENGRISKFVPIEGLVYENAQCAFLMENCCKDQINHVELDKVYGHTNNTDNNDMYDITYQESISFDDSYDKTIQPQDLEDTYECT